MLVLIAFALTNIAVLVIFAIVLERMAQHQHEERREHREEIASLLQRIQAPEVAVQQQAAQGDIDGRSVAVPLSDGALAERMQEVEEMERRLNAQVNGHFQLEDEIT